MPPWCQSFTAAAEVEMSAGAHWCKRRVLCVAGPQCGRGLWNRCETRSSCVCTCVWVSIFLSARLPLMMLCECLCVGVSLWMCSWVWQRGRYPPSQCVRVHVRVSLLCLISSPAAIPLTPLPQGMPVPPKGPWVTAGACEVISIQLPHSDWPTAVLLCVCVCVSKREIL